MSDNDDFDEPDGDDWGDVSTDNEFNDWEEEPDEEFMEIPNKCQYTRSIYTYHSGRNQSITRKNVDDEKKLPNSSLVNKWTSRDVIIFIMSLDPEYARYESILSPVFTKQNVNGSSLYVIREDHLESFGIVDIRHRTEIYSKIQQLLEKEREDCKTISVVQQSLNAFDKSFQKMLLQKERIKAIKQFNPLFYLPQILKILYSTRRMKGDFYHIGYPLELFVKYQDSSHYFHLLQYYNYICIIIALYLSTIVYLILFLFYVVELHNVYIMGIICGYAFNSVLQCYIFHADALYHMDYLIVTILKTPVLLLYNLIIKLQDYGLLSYDKWIFRKHGFYSDYYDYWWYWIRYDIYDKGIKIPQDIYQITSVKSSWLENSEWYKLLIKRFENLVVIADNFKNQIDFCFGMSTIRLNRLIGKLLSLILFVYKYLMSISYILWLSIIITLISGITFICGFYTILSLLVSFSFGVCWGRILWFGNFVLGYFVLFHLYCAAGLIILAGLGLWGVCGWVISIVWVMTALFSIGISLWISKHGIRLFYLSQKYGQSLFPILSYERKHLSQKEYLNH